MDTIPEVCSQQGVSWLCRKACEYEARISGYLPRSIQMKHRAFDWLDPDILAQARSRLRGELSGLAAKTKFEVPVMGDFSISDQNCKLHGRAAIVAAPPSSDESTTGGVGSAWEINFVSKLSKQHVIEACTYA